MKQKRKNALNKLNNKLKLKIIYLYTSGVNIFKIYKQLKVSQENIREVLINEGIKLRRANKSEIEDENIQNNIIEDYKNGFTIEKLYKKYHMGSNTISNFLKEK